MEVRSHICDQLLTSFVLGTIESRELAPRSRPVAQMKALSKRYMMAFLQQ